MSKTPEGQILAAVMDYLAAKRILAFRMNTGAVKTEGRFFRFGIKGMGDILAFPIVTVNVSPYRVKPYPIWFECKTAKGRQTRDQACFQATVEGEGHTYAVVRSIEDVQIVLDNL